MAVGELIVQLMAETGSFETDTKRAGDTVAKLEKLVKQLNSTMAQGYQASENFVGPLQPNKLRPAIEGVERLNRSVQQSQAAFRGSNQVIQNSAYQIQDFIVQVTGGVSAMRAFSQQAPQFLGAFGQWGAIAGIFAALGGAFIPLIQGAIEGASATKKFDDALKLTNDALSSVTATTKSFDMTPLIKEFNAADAKTRESIVSMLGYKSALLEVRAEMQKQSLTKEVAGLTDTGFLGQFSDELPSQRFASKMGIAQNKEMYAQLRLLSYGYGDVQGFVDKYSKTMIKGNEDSQKFISTMIEQANTTRELEMAQKAIAETQGKMQKAGAAGSIPIPGGRSGRTGISDADRLAKQELASADKFADALERQTKQLEFQQNLIGRNAQEVELLNAQYKVQAELEKTIQDMQRQGIEISQASMDKMNEAATAAIAKQQEIINSGFARRQDPMAGISDALRIYSDQANNVALGMQNAFTNSFKGMEDGIVKFAMTSKASFGDFVNAAISDLMRLYVRMAMMKLVQAGINAFAGLPDASGQQSVQGNSDYVYDLWKGGFAGYAGGGYTGEGNKYDIAGPVHKGEFVFNKEATNRIGVGTLYRMMRGYADGGYVGSTSMPTGFSNGININVKNEAGGAGYEAVASAKKNENGIDVEILVRKVISGDLRNNGPMAQQMTNTFGLRRAM